MGLFERERTFAAEDIDLFAGTASVAARRPVGAHHPMTRDFLDARIVVHDIPHGAGGARIPRAARDLLIGHRTPLWDCCHHRIYFLRECF